MDVAQAIRWPIAALIVTGTIHLLAEAVLPDLRDDFTPATIGPLLFAYGLWVGWAVINRGLQIGMAVAAGVVVGILPLALDVIGFGILLGRGIDAGVTAGAFGFLMVVFGSIVGAGFSVGQTRPA